VTAWRWPNCSHSSTTEKFAAALFTGADLQRIAALKAAEKVEKVWKEEEVDLSQPVASMVASTTMHGPA
jgi:hypothetical protein